MTAEGAGVGTMTGGGGAGVTETGATGPAMGCRSGCAACCIAPSISSFIPGMPGGKAAGARCLQLTADNRCRLFGRPERPAVCLRLRPEPGMCGRNAAEALALLSELEEATASPTSAIMEL